MTAIAISLWLTGSVWGQGIAVDLSAGPLHTCAVTSAGGAKCWGYNFGAELGDGTGLTSSGTGVDRNVPTDVVGLSSGVKAIAAGGQHSCALLSDSTVKCWGTLPGGLFAPTTIAGLEDIALVAAGGSISCAISNAGDLKCWGYNFYGQLGDGTTTATLAPVSPLGITTPVRSVSIGAIHTCAVLMTGKVKCWGSNNRGQLGAGFMGGMATAPTDVVNLGEDYVAVAAGAEMSCAVSTSGAVQCWGWNKKGGLGDGTTVDSYSPVLVKGLLEPVVEVVAGSQHNCARTLSGKVTCWGSNGYGELGNGDYNPNFRESSFSTLPVEASGLDGAAQKLGAQGGNFTCALLAGGKLQCWGRNLKGELGDGTQVERGTPVYVTGFSLGSFDVADLRIAQMIGPNPGASGKDVVFTMTATNDGPGAATNVVVSAVYSGNVIWASPGCIKQGALSEYLCRVDALQPAAAVQFHLVLRLNSDGALSNTATIFSGVADPNGANNESAGMVTINASPPGVPVTRYRLYSEVTKEHHFTTDLNEYTVLGAQVGTWVQEGTVGRVLNNPGSFNGVTAVPYYRLYDTSTRWHHWTIDANEYYTLAALVPGWNGEGVDGYILPTSAAGTTQLYRLNYPYLGSLHHWTIDPVEYNILISTYGWVGEGGSGFVIQ